MTCQVFLSGKGQRDLDGLPDKITKQILADCARLADDPSPDGKRIKKLQGFREALYRLRAGDYRVVFTRSGTRIDMCVCSASRTFRRPIDLQESARTRRRVCYSARGVHRLSGETGAGSVGQLRFRASRSGPSGLSRAETFWNSFSCDLTIAGLQSVPAFLLGQASAGTLLLRQRALSRRHCLGWIWRD